MNEPEQKKSLVTKLCEVMGAVDRVPKIGWNDFHKYAFARESDIVDAVRQELATRKVFIFPSMISHERFDHTTSKGNKTYITNLIIRWRFVDGESGEFFETDIIGVGEDSSDKGVYKAFTGSQKYMLSKTFLIPTGDDPENDGAPQTKAYTPDPNKLPQRPAPPAVASPEPVSNGEQIEGRLLGVDSAKDGECLFAKVGEVATWTRDKALMVALVKSQGQKIIAHVRKKTPESKSYQLISFVPSESQI